ncbi:MAG: hypothetical protein HC933_15880, partial [Pleurocapsa sp. SU_196_0]|nr:hypothetical protein [Pleurocapsa sp. SU_196_0]
DYRPRAALRPEERLAVQTLAAFVVRILESRRAMFDTSLNDRRETVGVSSSLEHHPLFGPPSESAVSDAPRIVSNAARTPEARLLARIRDTPPAPTPALVTRLSDDTAILVHDFGIAPPAQAWRVWTLGTNSPPRPLETFTAAIATLHLPDDAALVLLSQETRDRLSSHPTQVLASGKLERSVSSY